MAKFCVNINSLEFNNLKKSFPNVHPMELEMIVYEYSNKNNTDEYPSKEYIYRQVLANSNKKQFKFEASEFYNRKFPTSINKAKLLTLLNKEFGGNFRIQSSYTPKGAVDYFTVVQYKKEASNQDISEEGFYTLLNDLSKRLGVEYSLISKEQAKEILKGQEYNDEPAFFYKGKVYLTEINKEDAIHEFTHPFVRALIKNNPDLVVNILDEVKEYHPEIYTDVERLYPNYFKDGPSILALEEIAVRAITKLAMGNIDNNTGKSVLKRLWDAILNFISGITNIDLTNLKPTSTLQDLADLLTSYEGTISLNNQPLKPGVAELFESNPELANAVYEALGLINTSEIQLDGPKFNPDNYEAISYSVKINGEYAGVVSVDKDGYISSSIGMAGVELEKEFQGKGYGTKVYIALAEQLAKEGKTLKSEAFGKEDINKSANRVWKSLLDKGYAVDKGSYFEIQLKNKQQAQQQYSAYLDSIFPDSQVKDIVYHGTKYRAKLYNGKPLIWFDDINDKEAYFIYENSYDIKNKIKLSYEEYEKLPQHKFEKFKKKEHRYAGGDTFLGTGIYFTTSKEDANRSYNREGLYSAIINVKNPYTENKGYSNSRSGKGSQELIDKGYDAVTEKINNGQEYNVFEPEQIHILGSKQDIEGFREFVNSKDNLIYEIPVFNRSSQPADISTEHSSAIEFQKERLNNNVTDVQMNTVYKLVDNNLKVSGKTYTDGKEEYTRTTEWLKSLPGPHEQPDYFKFNDDDTQYFNYREWGNQYDDLIQAILMGYNKEDSYLHVLNKKQERLNLDPRISPIEITETISNEIYDETTRLIDNELEGYILIPQVVFKSEKNKVAGTSDIVAVNKDGEIKILDLKSSKVKYNSPFYNQEYSKDGIKSASKLVKYTAQLSIYKGMALEEGFTFEDKNELGIISVFHKSTDGEIIDQAITEGLFDVNAYQYILNMFSEKASTPLTKSEKKIIDDIKIGLEEQMFVLERNTNIKSGSYKAALLKKFKEALSVMEQSKLLNSFINETYNSFLFKEVGDKKIYGIKYNIRTLSNKIKDGSVSPKDALEELFYYKQLVEIYKPIVEQISAEFSKVEDKDLSSKIGEIIEAFNQIKKDYKESAIPLMADILYEQYNPEINVQVKQVIEPLKEELEKIKIGEGVESKNYKVKSLKLNRLLIKLKSEEGLTKESLIKTLEDGSLEDISTMDFKLNPAISSSNELISLFAKHLKEKLSNVRLKSFDLENIAGKAFDEYAKDINDSDVTKINSPFYKTVKVFKGFEKDGSIIYEDELHFTSLIDENAYNESFSLARQQANKMKEGSSSFMMEWARQNKQLRPQEDITVVNPYTNEKVVVFKGLKTLIKEKQDLKNEGIITQYELDKFIEDIKGKEIDGKVFYFNNAITMPNLEKYKSKDLQDLSPKQKKYYDFLLATYLKSQERLPIQKGKSQFVLPSVSKQTSERLFQDGIKETAKYKWKDTFSVLEEDIDKYGEKTSKGINLVPIIYANKMDIADVSKDLLRSIMMFDSATLIYEARTEALPLAQSLIDITKENTPTYRDSLGNKFLNEFGKKVGVQKDIKSKTNNVSAFLEAFVEAQIFGMQNISVEQNIFGYKIALDKLADSVKSFASKTQIGGINPIGAFANSLQANVQLLIESHGGQFFNKTEVTKAKGEYLKQQSDFIKDFNEGRPVSLIGQLTAIYDAIQGEYLDKYGNKITGTAARKLFSSDSWFFLHHAGEHEVQTTTMIAMLNSIPVTINGEKSTLYKAYELDSGGKIKLKEGVVLPGKLSSNGLISLSVQNKLHALNKRMHGVYNSFDQPDLKRNFMGRLLFMYRDFIVPGFKKRYKSIGIDNELDNITEGYYNTFWRKMTEDYKKMFRQLIGLEKSNLQDWEKANLRKAVIEMGLVFTTGLLVMGLTALYKAGDDDEKKYLKHILFLTMRLNNELGMYGVIGDPQEFGLPNVREVWKTFRQPSAIIGTVDRLMSLIYQLKDPFAEYQQDSGIFQKGDSKLMAKLYKLIGITGINVDPENAIKHIQMTTK